MYQAIKQLEEKNVATEVDLLLWSDCMDLVAVANIKGEVALHRLTWTRAWILVPYKEGIHVKAMAWKPDGQVIAVGYGTGRIMLVNVENKVVLLEADINADISCMMWFKEKSQPKTDDENDYIKYPDYSTKFLPDPPPLTNFSPGSTSEQNNPMLLEKPTELNLLIVGTTQGLIFTSIFGTTPFAVFDLNQHLGFQCSILNVLLSEDLNRMFVSIRDELKNVKIVIVSTDVFESHTEALFAIAMMFEYTRSLITYMGNTIGVIKETWENFLLEMDAKLSKYASKVPEGTLSADFLDLLTFGIASDHMQEFLLQDLTKKGLEKFGHTIEMSYANIQKLLLKNVMKVGQNITYHLAELRGMARFEYRYKALGLEEETITEAIASNSAFLNKSGEMQQVINTSMINYKAFFRWLYSAIMDLLGEQIAPDIPKMTQQDMAYIIEFLQNFDDIVPKQAFDGSKKPGFVMEKVGQYLVDAPLTIPSTMDSNDWNTFLNQTDCVKNHPDIIKHYTSRSLMQQFINLKESVCHVFDKPKVSIIEKFTVTKIINYMQHVEGTLRLTNINYSPTTVLLAFLSCNAVSEAFHFLEITTDGTEISGRAARVVIPETCRILDVQFYTANVLSVLMQENSANRFGLVYQCSVAVVRDKIKPVDLDSKPIRQDLVRINATSLTRHKDGMVASKFAVSGCRKVAIVLSETRRKIRIYEMEAEEEDDEDGDMSTSLIKESDDGE